MKVRTPRLASVLCLLSSFLQQSEHMSDVMMWVWELLSQLLLEGCAINDDLGVSVPAYFTPWSLNQCVRRGTQCYANSSIRVPQASSQGLSTAAAPQEGNAFDLVERIELFRGSRVATKAEATNSV